MTPTSEMYLATDFLGAGQTANLNQSDSFNFRFRELYMQIDRSDFAGLRHSCHGGPGLFADRPELARHHGRTHFSRRRSSTTSTCRASPGPVSRAFA